MIKVFIGKIIVEKGHKYRNNCKPPATCILFLKLFGIIFAGAEVCPVDWRASRV
jgi:hypothetical protein